jgi:hypothetical protein
VTGGGGIIAIFDFDPILQGLQGLQGLQIHIAIDIWEKSLPAPKAHHSLQIHCKIKW